MKRVAVRYALEAHGEGLSLDAPALQTGVAALAQHMPGGLHTALMQLGPLQRSYVTVLACGTECRLPDCTTVGCFAGVCARMLQANASGWRLRPAPVLHARPYTRAVVATPRPDARALTGALLHAWPEAYLLQAWQRVSRGDAGCTTRAILLVSADGPPPQTVCAAHGWAAQACPPALALAAGALLPPRRSTTSLHPVLLQPVPNCVLAPIVASVPGASAKRARGRAAAPRPSALYQPSLVEPPGVVDAALAAPAIALVSAAQVGMWPGTIWQRADSLPRPATTAVAYAVPAATDARGDTVEPPAVLPVVDDVDFLPVPRQVQMAVFLGLLPEEALPPVDEMGEDGTAPVGAIPEAVADDLVAAPAPVVVPSRWPDGPGTLRAAPLEALVMTIMAHASIVDASPPGLSKKRLQKVLPANTPHADDVTMALLIWFDAADVLEEPSVPERRWRDPRPVRAGLDGDAIADRLQATPLPDAAAVAAHQAALKQNGS